ncbi:MAG TPA: hypothetical protein VGM88_13310 [Kofleriaceae bacterium]|jgi:hypothetical protein
MRPEPRHLAIALLLLLGACDSFSADNVRTFACEQSVSDCIKAAEDPTCLVTYTYYHDDELCDVATGTADFGTCGHYRVAELRVGSERQWTIFDQQGNFVAILSLPPTGDSVCEVGPSHLDLGCGPATIDFQRDDCPIHEDAGMPPPDAPPLMDAS